jgi:hypothetical protein
MDLFNTQKRPKAPVPPWLKWAMLGFIAFAAFNAYRAEQTDEDPDLQIENYPKVDQFISKNHWQPVINPEKTEPTQEPETYGPHRPETTRDQTLTDDGSHSESR